MSGKVWRSLQGRRGITGALAAARIRCGWAQSVVGKAIGWSQGKVSTFEAHGDPKLGDIARYASAFGADVALRLVPRTNDGESTAESSP